MTARLRVLPISCREAGDPTHYLVLDGVPWTQQQVEETLSRLHPKITEQARGVLLVFGPEVALPEVDTAEDAGVNIVVNMDGVGQPIDDPAVIGRQITAALREHRALRVSGG